MRQFALYAVLAFQLFSSSLLAENTLQSSFRLEESHFANTSDPSYRNLTKQLSLARQSGKKGIVLFFASDACGYCRLLIMNTLNKPEIAKSMSNNFSFIQLKDNDLEDITYFNGEITDVLELSEKLNADLKPTLVFFNLEGTPVYKVSGLLEKNDFKHMLDEVLLSRI